MPNIEKIKKILPDNYFNIFVDIIKHCQTIYMTNLVDIMLAGSGGKGLIKQNWSDLDIYIITNYYDITNNIVFHQYLKSLKLIHVGETYYSKKDFIDKQVDDKTLVSMYEHTLNYNPLVFNNIIVPTVSLVELRRMYEFKKYVLFQDTLRYFLEYQSDNISFKKLIKQMLVLLKCYLLLKYNLFTTGYDQVFNEFNKTINKNLKINIKKLFTEDKNYTIKIFNYILNKLAKEL